MKSRLVTPPEFARFDTEEKPKLVITSTVSEIRELISVLHLLFELTRCGGSFSALFLEASRVPTQKLPLQQYINWKQPQ